MHDPHAQPQRRLILARALSIPRGAFELRQVTGPRKTYRKGIAKSVSNSQRRADRVRVQPLEQGTSLLG